MNDLDVAAQLEVSIRLVVALLLGAGIGLERELQQQPAGFRTHGLVSLGSAIFTVISVHAFAGPTTDPTRIAAQIVSGIGFLGGGAILHYGGTVRGLTTAGSLWAVAAVGMASGAGLYVVAVVGSVLIVVALEVFHRIEPRLTRSLARTPRNDPADRDADDFDDPDIGDHPGRT